jgi:hypothetical protein
MTEHTPTPWRVRQQFDPSTNYCYLLEVFGADQHVVYKKRKNYGTGTPMVENAELIVRAVNVHDELLNALKVMHQYYQGADMVKGRHAKLCGYCDVIAKAEGK